MESSAEIAKGALEQVCSGQRLDCMDSFYSESFVDHVNGEEHRGFAGIEASVALYRRMLAGLRIQVMEQLTQGDRVACRFVVTGTCWGRSIAVDGITISRLKDGRIVEDWSVTDTLSLFRQIRSLALHVARGEATCSSVSGPELAMKRFLRSLGGFPN